MNQTAATLLAQRALRQVDNGHCACHITADQVAELATCYLCKCARLAQAATLADKARMALVEHNLSGVMDKLDEIVGMSGRDAPTA